MGRCRCGDRTKAAAAAAAARTDSPGWSLCLLPSISNYHLQYSTIEI
jgi:hypothetical protein